MNRRKYLKSVSAGVAISPFLWAQQQNRPNLLFIMTDQQRWDTLSIAGNSVLSTPNLDRIANEGAFFENFYSTRAICVPARVSTLTGCSPHTTGYDANGDLGSGNPILQKTFDQVLHEEGYYTRYHGKWHIPTNVLYHDDGTTPVYDNPNIGNNDHNVILVRSEAGQTWTYGNIFTAFLDGICPYGLNDTLVPRSTTEDPENHLYLSSRYQGLYEALPMDKHRTADSQEFGKILVPEEYSFTAHQVKQTMQAIDDGVASGKPFAVTCCIGPPHAPMLVCDPWFSQFPAASMPVPTSINDSGINQPYNAGSAPYNDPSLIGDMIQCYYGMCKEVDHWVGELLNQLDALGLADNTMVIFTSDHGEMLGDHGKSGKGNLYEGAARVPGLIRFPNAIPAGTVVNTPAALMDLYPTIMDYLGVTTAPAVDGFSLRPLVEGTAGTGDHPDYCVAEQRNIANAPMYAVRTEQWKFFFGRDAASSATDALYDMINDPHEMNNLIGTPEGLAAYADVAIAMKARLVDYLTHIGSPELSNVEGRQIVPPPPSAGVEGELDFSSDPSTVSNSELALLAVTNKGNTVAANIGGRDCRAKADYLTDLFFYFNVDASLLYAADNATVAIECDYYVSKNSTNVWLRYESMQGQVTHPVKISDNEVGQWKTIRWYINDAHFGDGLTSGSNFHIRIPTGTEGYISRVKVILPASPDWPPFEIVEGNVQWSEASDALGWRLFEMEELDSTNGWNEVSGGIVATNGNRVYAIPGANAKSFFKMQKP